MDPRAYWVGFNLVRGIGAVRFRILLEVFGDLSTAWNATPAQLLEAGIPQYAVGQWIKIRSEVDLERVWDHLLRKNIQVLTWQNSEYPRRLREVDQCPPVIYLRGSLGLEDEAAIAVVGTRRASVYGKQIAQDLGDFLARNGITVVSGLARGVDGFAHEAVLNAGGRTIAVLGNGVDLVYPPEHRALGQRIIENGCLLSDYPPGTQPDSKNFPPRNRIISGLAAGVVVIEAGETSGALITASFAAEQGREVFAVPGNILTPTSKGTNRLIEQGARPLLNFNDLLDCLQMQKQEEKMAVRQAIPVDEMEKRLLDVLTYEPQHIDEISAVTSLPIAQVSATLAVMELKGLIRQTGSMQYFLARESGGIYKVG